MYMFSKGNVVEYVGRKSYKESVAEYIAGRSYMEVIDGLDKAFITGYNRGYYLYVKGYCYSRLGNHFRTISLCKQALVCGAQAEECYLLIGQSYECMNGFDNAEKNFLLGLAINPKNSEIKAAYAYLFLKNGFICDAYSFLEQAIKSDPGNDIVNHYIVYFYLHKESFSFEKYGLIKYLVDNSSKEIFKYIKEGKIKLDKKRYKAAMNNFEKAYLLDSENEVLADLLDELRLKSKVLYKPSLIIDIVGGWVGWVSVLVGLAFMTFLSLIVQNNNNVEPIFNWIIIIWVFIGVYKYILDSFYWKFYSWE